MPQPEKSTTLRGGCHCGLLQLEFSTDLALESIVPRACDCAFCQKHGAAYVSDPAGRLSVSARSPGVLHRYRQGSNSAQFLLCGNCGVLVAVVFEHDSRLHGAANAPCLEAHAELGRSVPTSPQELSPDEKISRWLSLWVPDVELTSLAPDQSVKPEQLRDLV